MTRSPTAGNRRENQVANILRDEGYVVGSLRHTLGGGDLIAVRYYADTYSRVGGTVAEVRLVESKSDAKNPYAHFGPARRKAMLEVAQQAGATAWLAWWPPRGELQWLPSETWPAIKEDA